ncbi:MAG: (d)CMP kinase [Bacillota bacterium]
MNKKLTIAIDGPAGAGKSTVAQIVAQRLGFIYIDTGAMYRAVTLLALREAMDLGCEAALSSLAQCAEIRLENREGATNPRVMLNGEDVTGEIRSPEVSRHVAQVAQVPGVRKQMVELQRRMGKAGGVVMDGRDIGTHVFPRAEIKIFLTASIEERALRRGKELQAKGYPVDWEKLKAEICSRDQMDAEREIAPLIQAPDAILLDTTSLDIAGVVDRILLIAREIQ